MNHRTDLFWGDLCPRVLRLSPPPRVTDRKFGIPLFATNNIVDRAIYGLILSSQSLPFQTATNLSFSHLGYQPLHSAVLADIRAMHISVLHQQHLALPSRGP